VGKEKLEGKRKKLAFIKRDRITKEVDEPLMSSLLKVGPSGPEKLELIYETFIP